MNTNISAWAIRKPLPSILLFIVLMALGTYSFLKLPVTYFPTINTPVVAVTVEQPGAAPSELETEVTRPVENALASLSNIEKMTSTITEGSSRTVVEFTLGTVSTDRALSEVRDSVTRIRSDLPDAAEEPIVERVEQEAEPVATYSISSTEMSLEEVSWFVDDALSRELQSIPDLARIERIGGVDREILIELAPDRLRSHSLTASEVTSELAASHLDVSGGRIGTVDRETVISTNATVSDVASIQQFMISTATGKEVALQELGRVVDSHAHLETFALRGGAEVVGFSVTRTQGASETGIADAVAERIEEIALRHPGLSFELVDDGVRYTRGNFDSAMHTLVEGTVLAVLVVFAFLKDWRATIIAAVALPLSAVPTFFVIDLLGFSLNILSLLAITLVTGILVDDAIVEIENVARHRNMGKTPYSAALDASDEIGLAVIAISATIIAVFAPVGFMSGEIGLYFRQFGLTIAIAVFFSLLVARLITPILAAYFLKDQPEEDHGKGSVLTVYRRFLLLALRFRKLTLFLAFSSFVLAIQQLASFPTSFLPEEDTGRLAITLELPPGSPLAETRRIAEDASARLSDIPEIRSIFVQGGTSASGRKDLRFAAITLDLGPASEREVPSSQIESRIEDRLRSIADIKFQLLNGRGGRDVSFAVLANDPDAALAAAEAILEDMSQNDAFVNPSSDALQTRPELRLTVLTEKAASLGISTAAIAETVRVSTTGERTSRLPTFVTAGRQIPIRLELGDSIKDERLLGLVGVPARNGAHVPLSSVVRFDHGETLSQIQRLDRERRIELGADMRDDLTSGQGLQEMWKLPSVQNLPSNVRLSTTGDSNTQAKVFESFAVAMTAGIMLVLTVLILLFGNFLAPWTILVSLPLSIGGVVVALWATGNPVSLPVVIGILMLMGIVTKNAIMLVDFAIERENAGLSRIDATVEACMERVRPIVMTTLAMVAGMVPSALAIGEGGAFRAPMAITVIGGLIASTFLSLVAVPALHLAISGLNDLLSRLFKRTDERNKPVARQET